LQSPPEAQQNWLVSAQGTFPIGNRTTGTSSQCWARYSLSTASVSPLHEWGNACFLSKME
jgi:hypothetical protein